MPHAIKVQKAKGKEGVLSILMESQGLPSEELRGFMMHKFPSNPCWVTSESPFKAEKQPGSIPYGCLMGVDGVLLWEGNPNGAPKKIEELIDGELKKIKAGWGKTPDIKKARMLMYSKGALGEAAAALTAAEATTKDDAKDDLAAAKAELDVRYAARTKGVKALMEQGRLIEAQKLAMDLQKGAKGKPEWETESKALVDAFATPDVDKELKLSQQLEKLLVALGDKSPAPEAAAPFNALAKKNAGSKVAALAAEYGKAIEWKPAAAGAAKAP